MEPDPTVQVPASGPLSAVFAVAVLVLVLAGGSVRAAGELLKK
jgi:hypothetical protein